MSAPCLQSTQTALGSNLGKCQSRSLWFDRFADPEAKEEAKAQFFEKHSQLRQPNALLVSTRRAFLQQVAPDSSTFQARLESRLMVNMAGGVMENANLCLDRFSGLPYIPGSAVKGCARRMALQQLHDAVEEHPNASSEHAKSLTDIALVFGWGDTDWTPKSDFSWAVHANTEILIAAARLLADQLGVFLSERHATCPWKALPNFGGSVAFHAAWPTTTQNGTQLGELELDVLTSHHPEYYKGNRAVALDDENPIPVVFPAVKPGHVFTFAVAPLREVPSERVSLACQYLKDGLQIFGVGAKTNAGYGWFSILESQNRNAKGDETASVSDALSQGDYSDKTFDNAVINRLAKPQEAALLQREIEKLKQPQNAVWLERLKTHLTSPTCKDVHKRLKKKDWFPSEWLG